jgi:cell fate regulator YaaT (PSP1 superfamily)
MCNADTNHLFVRKGSLCIVETEHGIDIGKICKRGFFGARKEVSARLLRVPTSEDMERLPEIEALEKRAFDVCRAKTKEKKLDMKLISVKSLFDKTKIIFFFVADTRIDFRELVRDLASVFRTRIEMRQIGVRDEARLIGGYGPCGRKLCCEHMKEGFDPVSIKMAKDQSLNLNSMKISGMCGRLLCCLSHEHEVYKDIFRDFPTQGTQLDLDGKIFVVEAVEPLKGKIRLRFQDMRIEVSGRDLIKENNRFSIAPKVAQRLLHTASDALDDEF